MVYLDQLALIGGRPAERVYTDAVSEIARDIDLNCLYLELAYSCIDHS